MEEEIEESDINEKNESLGNDTHNNGTDTEILNSTDKFMMYSIQTPQIIISHN